jgi:Cd2+/Zn2+-exporting ATPase
VSTLTKKQRRLLKRVAVALAIFVVAEVLEVAGCFDAWFGAAALWVEFAVFFAAFAVAGYDVVISAFKNLAHGHALDENFLMTVATLGAFALVFFPEAEPHMSEGAAVMIFFQVGELFQSYAVNRSRRSIADMMDIAPEFANVERDGKLVQVDPSSVQVGDVITVKPGERVPLDGTVLSGASELDTAALTGESVPRGVREGDEVVSGCINMTGLLTVRVSKPYGESTVARILELVENASSKKARTENFITRFARVYTPTVVVLAALIAVVPTLLGMGPLSMWLMRGLTFLVVSCPCALVISVPLSFFGGIGGSSRLGILVKGGNYLEALAKVDTVVFDKTGTLTNGSFQVAEVRPAAGFTEADLLRLAAHAEAYSDHPLAVSVRRAYGVPVNNDLVGEVSEDSGHGVSATVDGAAVLVGNDRLMARHGVQAEPCATAGTVLHVAADGRYAGCIVVADVPKPKAKQAIDDLRAVGVRRTVMLTGDREPVAAAVAGELGLDSYRAQLLPQDKVAAVEELLAGERDGHMLAFVGDGINDAPVLTRADVGVAMGAMGSDAAIEAADVVLMDDDPTSIAKAVRIARKTMGIVWQNIVFAIGVKVVVLVLAAVGVANMWMAVFADVGVAVIAILNAMRCLNVGKWK